MVTSPQEYWKLLYLIQDKNTEFVERPIPGDEPIYDIDLETRTIDAPKTLAVQNDSKSECIYFRCPRHFESMDLTLTTCIIMYTNANGDNRIYPVPFYDAVTEAEEDNILIPWILDREVTRCQGPVKFAVRFYQVDADNLSFAYCLNTQPATSIILESMETTDDSSYQYSTAFAETILDRLARLEKAYNLYWLEVQ